MSREEAVIAALRSLEAEHPGSQRLWAIADRAGMGEDATRTILKGLHEARKVRRMKAAYGRVRWQRT